MKHICVIGDSSAAALKAAWTEIAHDHDDVSLTFFASPGESVRCLELIGRRLVPSDPAVADRFAMTSGGLSIIDLDDFDDFWIAGLGVSVASSVDVYAEFRSEEHADLGEDQVLVSQEAFDLMVKARIRNAAAPALVQAIAPIVGTVRVISRPLPCHDIVSTDSAWAAAVGADGPALVESFRGGLDDIATDRMVVHSQPAMLGETLLTTKPEYSRDAIALDLVSKAPEADVWHMNASYGVEVLRDVLASGGTEVDSSVRPVPVPGESSSLCSKEMLQRPPSPLAEYFKDVRRRYDELFSATVVMANVTCPRSVEMVQYLTAAKEMFVFWSEDHGDEVVVPAGCRVRQWSLDGDHGAEPRQAYAHIGAQPVDIVVDCRASHDTYVALSHLVERPGCGYLAMTESSPPSAWSTLVAELCLDVATHHHGRRDVVMDDRHIWAMWTRGIRRSEIPQHDGLRPALIDTFVSAGAGA